jgi:hypothetical protein
MQEIPWGLLSSTWWAPLKIRVENPLQNPPQPPTKNENNQHRDTHNPFPRFVRVNDKKKLYKTSEFGENWVYEKMGKKMEKCGNGGDGKAGGGNGWWRRGSGGVWWVARGEKVVWGYGACDDERKKGGGLYGAGLENEIERGKVT